ncbi:aminotransferase class I/II-fold pyridoxal phosphate-dependent enzyme [Picosynechococcus sp. PCC 73109]|uniref:aminotransferase class I/II-fold pyridoxal phosphate-dependent enzyme n=1 Tax=Picosynechococcus sp. PCC 73109 TaxID=374982 RepID=UPI0007457E3E|nr:aminotransferase class I/II-fold pyridoxal phosphate-dependent enzyme [Picosynechococcus sp. PCC 73109]AMA08884.1 lysine decarboxylase [Picosynechococcus sp. PCC 73109]
MTPLFSRLLALAHNNHAAFYAPGHKGGQGIFSGLAQAWGKEIFRADLPELPDLDNLFAPEGVILEAQTLAAETFGADQTWFLINGSTCGIIAVILAMVGEGEKILLPRNVHQSAISGLILSGAIPVFVNSPYDPQWDLSYGLTPESVEQALQIHPDIKAVFVLSPTYQGVCPDLKAIAAITQRHNIPLIVDEAHGSHFKFHPNFPPPALELGADLVIQSTHKTLGAMTQASMLHLRGTRVDPQKINRALQLVESTSPSYLLLASLDAARAQMATRGETLWSETLTLAQRARQALIPIPGLKIFDPQPQAGIEYFDPTRLTVDVSGLGLTGYAADEILTETLGVIAELPLGRSLTFILTFGNTNQDIQRLIDAFQTLSENNQAQQPLNKPNISTHQPETCYGLPQLSPRQAFFATSRTVALEASLNQICAELICPYPPGIPAIMPGEKITAATLASLRQTLQLGGVITGANDPSLKTIRVID